MAYKDNDNLRKALRLAMRWEKTAPEENDSQSRSQAPVPAQAPNSSHDVGEAINDLSVSFIPNSEFGLGKAGELCALLTIVGMPQQLDPEGRMAFLSYVLGEDGSIIRTVGGLLSFILQNGVLGSISEDDETIHINAISHKNFCDVVQINRTTLLALHVFSHETHPVGRGSMKAKEGLSLFGIIKPHIKTVGGRSLLRSWLHYPTTNIDEIQQRQLLVQSLREGSNHAFLTTVKDALRGVKNVPGVIYRLRRVSADIGDWKALYSSTRSFIVILETLKVVAQQKPSLARSPVVTRAGSFEESHLRDIAGWMDAIIDFDESCASGKLVVAPGFSEEIDEMKRCYSGLDDFLTSVGVQELEKFVEQGLAQLLESLQFTYQPQIGYLVVLSEKSCDAIGFERLEGFGFSFVFSSADEGFHFKNDRCRELDEELGDIHGAILDLEAKAYRYLEEKVFECTVTLLGMSKVSIELDCLQALACSANEFSWTMPDISEEYDCLNIEEGRHALVELTVPSFVPNSTRMKFGDVHILTG